MTQKSLTNSWTLESHLPSIVGSDGTAITVDGKIYLIGGQKFFRSDINQVLCFDPIF